MMNNRMKGLIITGTILFLTLGTAAIRMSFFPPSGFYYGGPGLLLLLPALPFIWIVGIFESNLVLATTIIFILSTIFWLTVGYAIGAWLDKKNKK